MVVVRPATPGDAPALMAVRRAVRENAISDARLAALGIDAESVAAKMASTHAAFCAEIDGEVVGFSMADRTDGSIWALFVHPDHERQGIGRALLDHALEALWALGHPRASLSTDPDTRAEAFYRRAGWKAVGTNERGEVCFELEGPTP